jgi:hypothetical protein
MLLVIGAIIAAVSYLMNKRNPCLNVGPGYKQDSDGKCQNTNNQCPVGECVRKTTKGLQLCESFTDSSGDNYYKCQLNNSNKPLHVDIGDNKRAMMFTDGTIKCPIENTHFCERTDADNNICELCPYQSKKYIQCPLKGNDVYSSDNTFTFHPSNYVLNETVCHAVVTPINPQPAPEPDVDYVKDVAIVRSELSCPVGFHDVSRFGSSDGTLRQGTGINPSIKLCQAKSKGKADAVTSIFAFKTDGTDHSCPGASDKIFFPYNTTDNSNITNSIHYKEFICRNKTPQSSAATDIGLAYGSECPSGYTRSSVQFFGSDDLSNDSLIQYKSNSTLYLCLRY